MKTAPYSVLVVDDSAMMRSLLGRIIESDPRTTLAGKAMDGRFALDKIERLKPEVIVLDLAMPKMDGIEFLVERRRRRIDIPVIVLSAMATTGAKVTMEALSLGAAEFILKPSDPDGPSLHEVAGHLLDLISSLGAEYRVRHGAPRPTTALEAPVPVIVPDGQPPREPPREPSPCPRRVIEPGPIELVAIGISTGGPNALRKILALVPADLGCPIVIVQHMPAGFTTEFARGLNLVSPLTVKEAEDGDRLRPGVVYVARGGHHMTVTSSPGGGRIRTTQAPPCNGHRPSADVLLTSVAEQFGNRAIGVIMTGMGKDGAAALGLLLRAGGITIGQDEASSVVYGMPKAAYEMGHVEYRVPLSEMADTIARLVKGHQE